MRCFAFLLLAAVVLSGVALAGTDCKNGLSDKKIVNEKWGFGKYYDKYPDAYQDKECQECQGCQDKQYKDDQYKEDRYKDDQYKDDQYKDAQMEKSYIFERCDGCNEEHYWDGRCDKCGDKAYRQEYCPICGTKSDREESMDGYCDNCGKKCYAYERCDTCKYDHYYDGYCDRCSMKCTYDKGYGDYCDMYCRTESERYKEQPKKDYYESAKENNGHGDEGSSYSSTGLLIVVPA